MILGLGRKEPTEVGCYGKLPLHGDYLSHASDGTEARRLAAWIDEGYRLAKGEEEEGTETRFLFPAHGKRALFGAVWPSSDSSGTRRFPFALFSQTPVKPLATHGAGVPYALATLWDELSLTLPYLKESDTVEAIGARLAAMKLPATPAVQETQERFRRDAGLPGADVSAAMDALLDLVRLGEALGGGAKPDLPNFAVRIPLKTGYAPEVESVAWLRFLAARLRAPEIALQCHMFIRTNRKALTADLFLFHRDLKSDDFLFVLSPSADYPYANLLDGSGEDPAAERFGEWFGEAMGDGATLNELLTLDLSSWTE
jgi:type VI secretion system ImpM family protein